MLPPAALADDLRRLTSSELSLPSRLRYVSLLLASSTMTSIVIALLVTEPVLPARTTVALGVVALIGLTWTVFAAWVLTHKRVLLAGHRIVAGRLAIVFTSVFVLGAAAIGVATSNSSAFVAAAMGAVMLGLAVTMLTHAKRRFAQLSSRRDELQQLLGRGEA
jgi:membrane associated rhomboid family serine protease